MKKISLEEKIEVMTHYLNGGKVEVASTLFWDWASTNTPIWDWNNFTYRKLKEPNKVTIEKWLLRYNDIVVIVETDNIDKWIRDTIYGTNQKIEKLKLIESYEVEI